MHDKVEFQDYLVLFLDVLGQRQHLRQMVGVPTTEKERIQFISLLKKTLNVVLMLRDSFKTFFEAISIESPFAANLPTPARDKIRQVRRAEVFYHGFSDSIIVAVPLKNDDENCTPMNGVHRALVAACGLPLLSLAAGHPLRGGLDIGVGTRLDTGEVYGAALERAYTLESSLAEYPRILVGAEFQSYLRWVLVQTPRTDFGRIALATAQRCQRFVYQDTDDRLMLDFLGDAFRESIGDRMEPQVVREAYEFVRRQVLETRQKEDHVLASRYFRLLRYFDEHRGPWKLS